jgi:tRNA(fMet)-specific endonuclease VapC
MLRHMLDTNIVVFVIRRRPASALEVFNWHAGRVSISAITLAELMHGAEKSSRPEPNLAVVEDFCGRLEVLPYGPKAAQHYDQIRSALEAQGKAIGVNDLHIAAHTRSEGLIVVTNNRREFDCVPALQVEDWSL